MRRYRHYRPWTQVEDDTIRASYPEHTDEEIGDLIGRTPKAITHRRARLGLARHRRWTQPERDIVIRMYGAYATAEIAKHLGRTQAAIHYQVHDLGLPHWTTGGGKPCAS